MDAVLAAIVGICAIGAVVAVAWGCLATLVGAALGALIRIAHTIDAADPYGAE